MDRRVLLTVVISMGILFVWTKWFAPPPPPRPAQSAQSAQATPSGSPAPAGQPSASPSPSGSPAADGSAPAERAPEKLVTHTEKDLYIATFSSWGASPVSWKLASEQFRPGELVRGTPPRKPLVVSFAGGGVDVAEDAPWTVVSEDAGGVVFAWESADAKVTKRYRFIPGTYQVDLGITVENKSDKALSPKLSLVMNGWQDPKTEPGGMFKPRVSITEGACDAGKLKKGNVESLVKSPLSFTEGVRWVGQVDQYFVQAASVASVKERRCDVNASLDGSIRAVMQLPEQSVPAHGKVDYVATAFIGPKILQQLDAVKVGGGTDAGFGSALDFGWTEIIARPMLAVLKALYKGVPNWGLCIILLTLIIKAVTFWPTQQSMKSMKAMAKLKPEMDKLQKKHADDKAKLNEEVMKLYKQHGVNPVGGCLPMLIQMPIYIALYSMLGNSVELYRSGFFGQIHDLTAPDPWFILPIATGVFMFAQQRFSPAPADDSQKMMMYMMPVMFTGMSIFLPAGLTIYILTNTVLTMAQQWWMNRNEPHMKKANA